MFSGSTVAIITPWKEDTNSVDFAVLEELIDWHIDQGTNAILPCGTTGESPAFTHEEQFEMVQSCVKFAKGKIPVIAGAGSNCTREAVNLAKQAEKAGADGILSITPYYNKPTQEGLFRHFEAVRSACKLPIVLYNVPSRTGCNMTAETVARVAKLGGIDSVKEASGDLDQVQEILDAGVRVLSGEDGLTWPIMAMGGSGVVSVVANFAPKLMSDLCVAAKAGDMAKAKELHKQVFDLAKVAFIETNPIPAKTALNLMGKCGDAFRLPLVQMTEPAKEKLIEAMKKYSLI